MEQFLPFNYTQTIFQRLHTLRQAGLFVDDYPEEFYQLVVRKNLSETEEQQVARCIAGLRQSIQDVLSLYSLWIISKTYQQALTVEKQQFRSRASAARREHSGLRTCQFQDYGDRPEDAPSRGHRDAVVAPINLPNIDELGARVQGSNLTLNCFKCGEADHNGGNCRKSNSHPDRNKQLMNVDENLDDVNGYDGDPIYDEEPDEDDLVYRDVRESLVIQNA
ncbi:hypothetical protein AMTRI_Chr04g187010 [Amborella trichopoda]